MDTIAEKDDSFKFFAHNNIIINEIIRIQHYSKGNTRYGYLPPNSMKYLGGIEVNNLIYDFKKDKREHIKIIRAIVSDTLKKTGCTEEKYFKILAKELSD